MIAESERNECASCPDASEKHWTSALTECLPHWKGPTDFVLAALLLLATAPIIILAVVLVKSTSAGPAFYSQTRIGRRGRPFLIHKLRSMVHDCETRSGPKWSTRGDP